MKEIWLDVNKNTLDIKLYTFFCRTKTLTVPLESMFRDKSSFTFDSTVEIGCDSIPHKIATRGTGVWLNRSMLDKVIVPLPVESD